MRGRYIVAVAILGWTLAYGDKVHAQSSLPPVSGSVYGAQAARNSPALSMAFGWPSTYLRVNFPSSGRFNVGLQGDLYYGMPHWGFETNLGGGISLPMRIQVLQRRNWALALTLRPGMYFGSHHHWYWDWPHHEDGAVFGPNFGIGLVASVTPVRFLNVFFGLRNSIHVLIFAPDGYEAFADVFVPIQFFAGLELQLHRNIGVFSSVALGPTVGSYSTHCHHWHQDHHGYLTCTDWHDEVDTRFSGQFYTGVNFFF